MAEPFNAKIKLFRAKLYGIDDKKFFLFRIATPMLIPTKIRLIHFSGFVLWGFQKTGKSVPRRRVSTPCGHASIS